MEVNTLIEILQKRGYDYRSAKLVSVDLLNLSNPLSSFLESWLKDRTKEQNYELHGYSLKTFMEERNMSYPAALLTMDWLIKDPTSALISLKRGIK